MRHKDFGIWQTWTWAEALDLVRAYAVGLSRAGLKRGETIAIVGSNRPKLYWSVMAAQMLGAIPVPVYADAVADELCFVLAHADVRFAAVEDQEQIDKIQSVLDRLPKLELMFYDETRGLRDYDHAKLRSMDDVIAEGRAALAADAKLGEWLDNEIAAGKGSDPSIILYTSGTTGASKGVVLTGERSIKAATDTVVFDKLNEYDVALAYLPLAWVGDHYLNYAQGLVAGFCTACPESADTAMLDLREIGPSFYFAPPRTLEVLLTRVMIRMEDASAIKRKMFHYFIGVARQYGERILNGEKVPLAGRLLYAIGNVLVYAPLKNVLGFSRVRVAYTAGEAIGPDLFAFYRSIGLNLKQLYGQTEAFLYVTAQPDGAIYSDTVGPACPNVDIRIAENGEVLFKSPGMFTGYFKDAAKTAEVMTPDGYVMTGDAGYFDEKTGHLKIIDRAKDVGHLNDGTMFPPKYIENKLKFYPDIREAVAYGDKRDFVTVMLNIDLTAVSSWAERNNVSYGSYQELAGHPQVYAMMEKHVADVNSALAADKVMAGAQIKRFLILHKELDADDGELTRTQKVRRGFVAERYEPLIRALYDGSTEADISTEVTFEDGRKGTLEGHIKIMDMKPYPARAAEPLKEAAE
jgi:long-chain acyl-CoA synthetase